MRFEAGVSMTSNGAARITLFDTRMDAFHQWFTVNEAAAAIQQFVDRDRETVSVDTLGLGGALADNLEARGVTVKRVGLLRRSADCQAVSDGELVAMAQEVVAMLSSASHLTFDQCLQSADIVDELARRHDARQFTEASAMVQALRVRAAS